MLYHTSNNYANSYDTVQTDLDLLDFWCKRNLVAMNVSKTKTMYFSHRYLKSTSKHLRKLMLGVRKLDFIDDYKYLGVTIDCKLSFKRRLNNSIKTVSFKSSQLSEILSLLQKKPLDSYIKQWSYQ